MNVTSNIYKINTNIFLPPGGLPLWRAQKLCIDFAYIRCNTCAYIRCNIDAYIRCPYTHAYIRSLAAADGNNGDCTVVVGNSALYNDAQAQVCVPPYNARLFAEDHQAD